MFKRRIINSLLVITISFFINSTDVSFAEEELSQQTNRESETIDAEPDSDEVSVKVRAIRATNPINTSSEDNVRVVDTRLKDISTKLDSFEFKNFRMVSEEDINVPLKKKTTINLTDKTLLNVRPLYAQGKKVGMWIKWTDNSGSRTLIDTRMHFTSDENMLAGTNCHNDRALILAVSAVSKK